MELKFWEFLAPEEGSLAVILARPLFTTLESETIENAIDSSWVLCWQPCGVRRIRSGT
jgi:hypothetical protein